MNNRFVIMLDRMCPLTEELIIPPAKCSNTVDLNELRSDIKSILAHVGGSYDINGEHHPGLSHRVTRLERAVNWAVGIAATLTTACITTVVGVAGYWLTGSHK